MNAQLFNFHDLVVIITATAALLMCASLFVFPKRKNGSTVFLAGFFFFEFLRNILSLAIWHSVFRPLSFEYSAFVTSLYIVTALSKGVFLYFYVLSILDKSFSLHGAQILHLLLSPVAAILLVLSGAGVFHIAAGLPFVQAKQNYYLFALFMIFVPWCYSLLCYRELSKMNAVLKDFYSSESESTNSWFKLLIIGYVVVWSWQLFTQIFAGYLESIFNLGLPNAFGVLSNYLEFALLYLLYLLYAYNASAVYNRLVLALDCVDVSSIEGAGRNNSQLELNGSALKHSDPKNENQQVATGENIYRSKREIPDELLACAEKITEAMVKQKVYLDHDINLQSLADGIGERPRKVSNSINVVFCVSFFELVNKYRVEEAKRLLLQKNEIALADVISRSGFSSKSAFHRAFRGVTQTSPSQFRKANYFLWVQE